MKEWIPFLQTLIWPTFLILILILARKHALTILRSISSRIEQGDPFQAGPTGISLGQSDKKFTRMDEIPKNLAEGQNDNPTQYKNVVYLRHTVAQPRIGTDLVERRPIQIIVDADSEDILDKIERVVYHLHPTFPKPDREVTDRRRSFILRTEAWGEFNLSADIYFKGFDKPLTLYRYLNIFNF